MKNKHFIIILIIGLITVFLSTYTPLGVKADSGFDYSYDSGSSYSSHDYSSSSDSSWSSSSDSSWSSSDSSYDSDYSSSRNYGTSNSSRYESKQTLTFEILWELLLLIIFEIFMPLVIYTLIYKFLKSNNYPQNKPLILNHSKEISDEEVQKYLKDFERIPFLRARFNDYKKIQEDWMNFNYDGLRENLTDELYNQYEMQLETLKTNNQKNIMKDITYKDSMITGISEENNQIKITVELMVSQIDYIEKYGNVVRGHHKVAATVHYRLTFVIAERPIKECPNCGAPLNNNATQKCEYCGSMIAKTGTKCILSKKECLNQR